MQTSTAVLYAAIADKRERDPYGPDGGGRAVVVNGRGWQKYRRFHPSEEFVSVFDDNGREWFLTSKQAQVFDYLRGYIDRGRITMRDTAAELKMAPSTVSRAVTKLVAIGILTVIVGRGRYAGMVIITGIAGDYLSSLRKAAKARVRRWSEAAQRRISRLFVNVASYVLEEGRGYDSLTSYVLDTHNTMDATLTTQRPWTVQELRDSGII